VPPGIYARNLLFDRLAETASAKLCIRSLISRDIAARQWRLFPSLSTRKREPTCPETYLQARVESQRHFILVKPLPFVPASVPRFWIGGGLFGFAFALAIWAIRTIRGAGTRIETNKPTTLIVTNGPFRFTRNPVYIGMLLGQTGIAIGFDNLWVLAMLVPFYLVIRYGVVAREEAYLERKFGDVISRL
jgi:Phospholipid methyltransferase